MVIFLGVNMTASFTHMILFVDSDYLFTFSAMSSTVTLRFSQESLLAAREQMSASKTLCFDLNPLGPGNHDCAILKIGDEKLGHVYDLHLNSQNPRFLFEILEIHIDSLDPQWLPGCFEFPFEFAC